MFELLFCETKPPGCRRGLLDTHYDVTVKTVLSCSRFLLPGGYS
uniref:Uncharacterized protein n=1 Tax=Anguilla anguilla TaxID=7936 RepID=A0A0E9WFU6_ANGAN